MIGVIADDLTGAAEIGAVGRRHGLRAEIIHDGPADAGLDLVCFNTNSRSCDPRSAARRAAKAAAALADAGADWIYKKTDSVLRGPVMAELDAILGRLEMDLALLLPANPSLGRVIRDGRYYIRGRPLHQTEFARDPEHPRRSAEVRSLLGRSRNRPIHVCRAGAALPGSGIVVCEAGTSGDVRRWAGCRTSGMLAAGGAEFFGALLQNAGLRISGRGAGGAVDFAGRELFVCGSTSDSARRFMTESKRAGTPVFSLPRDVAKSRIFNAARCRHLVEEIIDAVRSKQRVVLNIALPRVRGRSAAARLAERLVQVAALVLRRTTVDRIYAEGGATAMELVRRMGWKRLKVLREAAPGVATLAVEGGKSLLTIKPGTYVWPEAIRTRDLNLFP